MKISLVTLLAEALTEGKETFEVENVYVNGKRVGGITQAASEKQAVMNIIIRHLPDSQKKYPAPHIIKALQLKGFKVKKADPKPIQAKSAEQQEFWWHK